MQDFRLFCNSENPDILLFICPVAYLASWSPLISYSVNSSHSTVIHLVADGLPIRSDLLAPIRIATELFTGTHALATHLQSVHGLESVVIPYGVDLSLFTPLSKDRIHYLRRSIGLEHKYLVGVFGRNDERKQHPRVLSAAALLRDDPDFTNLCVYMHCQSIDRIRGWNLNFITERLRMEEHVLFPHNLNQMVGVGCTRDEERIPQSILDLSYTERLAICDVVVNAAFCGGFELSILETQAMGVPLVNTNDNGNMAEVTGNGGLLIDGSLAYWITGADQYLVEPLKLAEAVKRIRNDTDFRSKLISNGYENSRRYSWENCGGILHRELTSILLR